MVFFTCVNSSDIILAVEDAEVIQPLSTENIDNTDDTDDTYDTDDTDVTDDTDDSDDTDDTDDTDNSDDADREGHTASNAPGYGMPPLNWHQTQKRL